MDYAEQKQTAVEFLIKEFSDILGPLDTKPMQDLLMMDAMKRAKAMEKEQIIDTFQDSRILSITNNCNSGENYYNETFNK
jgi:hypothetical protein